MIKWFSALFILLLGVSGIASAQTPSATYPIRQDQYVNDLANVLSPTEETTLRDLVRSIARDFDMTVLTINSTADYDSREPTIETFSTNLFNRWGVGSQARNTGVLIVLAVKTRDIRIELGAGYGTQFNDDMQDVINQSMIPMFKENQFALGLSNGAAQIYQEIRGHMPSVVGTPWKMAPTQTPNVVSSFMSSINSVAQNPQAPLAAGGAGALGVLGIGFVGWRRYQRNKPRICPQCQTQMRRLDEAADDAYLDEGQRMEEQLGSVDYDVWECPGCQTRSIFNYGSMFSSYSQCSKCSYRTESRHSYVVVHATEYSTGLRRVEADCRNCGNHREWTETIPRVQRSSSSSSSGSRSSGGGSSSGGGASGKW